MNTMYLQLYPQDNKTTALYSDHKHYHEGDCGLDLFFPEDVVFDQGETKIVDLKIKAKATTAGMDGYPISYDIRPRSSIFKTPLRLANSIGTIDAGYRGNLMVALDHIKHWHEEPYVVKAGTRLVQLCSPTLSPVNMEIVNELDKTERGEGGFGSTGV